MGEQGFWSPLAVAQMYRAFVVGEKLGAEMLAKRTMLAEYAPVPGVLLDASLDHPEIATAYGDELIVVRLERDEAGLYHGREVEWLKRKPDGTQGYSLLPADATPAQRLIREYSEAVWARLLPRLESLSFNEISQETERIAEVHLVPKPDLLLGESRRILAKLPKAGLPDRSRWRPRSPQLIAKAPSDAAAEAALEKLVERLPQGSSRPLFWNPLRLARGIRMSLFAELEGTEWLGRRAMIEAVALYPPDAAADAAPNHPVIVTRTGNEMTVVALRRNESGCYDLERFEWLLRVDGPAEGTLAKAADGRVYRSAAERDAVAALEQLGALILRDSSGSPHTVHLKGTRATNLELVHLEGLPHLKHLDLFGTNISDNGLAHLGHLAELERLELNGTGTTDAGLEHLKGLTNLRILNLADTKVSDAGLVHLAGMNRLESLTLYATKLTDAGLAHLEGLTSLVDLSLGCTQVTDAGLAHLEALKRLEGLDLRHTKVSDAGLEHLEALAELRSLMLDGTAVTEAGLNKLRQKLPRLDQGRFGPQASGPAKQPAPSEVDRAIELIERHHAAGADRSDLAAAAIQGMLDKFDPDSAYVGLDEMAGANGELGQGLVGVGLELKFDDEAGELLVITPLPDMPAHKAGVRAGDRIVAIDGRPTSELPQAKRLQTAVKLLRGKAGEAVTVTIERAGSEASQEITIVRAPIRIETVKGDTRKPDGSWQLMLDEERKIGYVRLIQFGPRTAQELQDALNQLSSQGMKGLILDLRNNPGGSLSQAVRIADLFVQSGIIVTVQGRDQPGQVWSARSEGTFEGFAMAVLVNHYCAGAAEIVAACLQDQKRAMIVGERTFGRGIAQSVFELEGAESALRLTTATFLRPSGKGLHRSRHAGESDDWGVLPDEACEVKLSPEELVQYIQHRHRRGVFRQEGPPPSDFEDRQLEKALACLRTLLDTFQQP